MIRRILGPAWTLDSELEVSRELISRLSGDITGRLGACLIVAAVVAYTASLPLALAWASLIFVNEITELGLARKLRQEGRQARRWLIPYLVHLSTGSALWTMMCLVLWIFGNTVNILVAGAVILGILIHVSLFYNESRLQTLITGLPPIVGAATMIVWCLFDTALGGREKVAAVVALATLVAYLSTGAYKSVMTRETLKSLVRKTARLAGEDALTGLQNRRSFMDLVRERTNACEPTLVVFVDLDRFKPVNDEYGHAVGDQVLQQIGQRLLDQPNVLGAARLGGDEFAALLADGRDREQVEEQMLSLHRQLTAPIRSDAGNVFVGASIGWVRAGGNTGCVSEALHSADAAMRRAKVERLSVVEFDSVADSAALASSAIEIAFRHALAARRIRPALQPIVSVTTGNIVSMELLARWPASGFPRDPVPQDFIPIAERLGLLNDMLWSTLHQALPSVAGTSWALAINVSPSQLTSYHFLSRLSGVIAQHGVPPSRIELEVTEQVVFRNVTDNCAVLDDARAMGFRVVLDDFGTGYSSLAMLDRLPLDKIKLDRVFVGELKHRTETQKILKATVSLAHELGMTCSVEGIECAETAAMVTAFGCDQMQGYWVGMPELIEQGPVLLELAS